MSNPEPHQLARAITAALPHCNDAELEQLGKMVNAIEHRRTIQALLELREAVTYSQPFGRNHD